MFLDHLALGVLFFVVNTLFYIVNVIHDIPDESTKRGTIRLRRLSTAESGSGKDEDLLGAPDISSLADLTTGYEAVRRMIPMPLSKESLMPLVVAVLLPMLAVGATQLPLKELLSLIRRLLL